MDQWALDGRSDEELVAYVVAAYDADHPEAAKLAAGMITWRQTPLVEGRVAAKIPVSEREDVVMAVFESFIRSAFDGKVILSVSAFIATIAKRRIADFHRERERIPGQEPLLSEHLGEEEIWGEEPYAEDAAAEIEIKDAIERVIIRRSELHRRMIMLYAPEPMDGEHLSGAEVVERIAADTGETVSVDNVQQVWRRFKVELEKELRAGDHGRDPDD